MRTPILAAAGAAAMLLAGCASQAAVTVRAATTARIVQSPQQLADADAASMLADFRPPPGAVRSGPIAVQVLSAPPEQSGTPDAALRTAWWRADGKPADVLAWVRAHLADGFTLDADGASSGPSADQMQFDQFDLPAVPGVLTVRWLLVSVAEADSPDRTAIRVDAEVDWEPAKSPAERIPSTAKVVTITPVAGLRPLPAGDRPVTITDEAKVAKIAAAFDGLPLFPRGGFFCPADFGRSMVLTFRASVRGPALAEVTSQTGGCNAVTVTIEGRSMPTLWHGLQLEQQVVTIADLHWPGFFSY
jgi:hypothetical protein